MNRLLICLVGAVVFLCPNVLAQTNLDEGGFYSTCPALKDAVFRSVVYKEVSERKLRKWATLRANPKATGQPQLVHVRIQVEAEGVFCAQALDGPPDKQKAAVESAMTWRFKKNRGDFNSDVIGKLTFRF
jgi:hypothetical protein